ncbi:MAG: hypothetical protein HUU46_04020 [Candidatus Hydrogenedentes bacterium]|nr:hypothetical protein [Candidatus Hydrogenedentota bacterium]
MKLLVSTIKRGANPSEPSSSVYTLSDCNYAVGAAPNVQDAALRRFDSNPRGGMRGARGVAVGDGATFVANFDSVFRYDRAWNLKGVTSHPWCADIHDIALHDGRLWVASTRNDCLVQFDLDGNVRDIVDPWGMGFVEEAFGVPRKREVTVDDLRDPRTHEKSQTDRLHLNSFAFTDAGDLIISLGQIRVNGHCESALVKLGASGGVELIHRNAEAPVPAHNIVALPDGRLLHCDTGGRQVVAIEPQSGCVQPIIKMFGGYTRGLCRLNDDRMAVGVQNEVWMFDPDRAGHVERIRISDDPRESIHSIVCA